MAAASSKTQVDMEKLLDIFMSPDFDPLDFQTSAVDDEEFEFEAETIDGNEEQADSAVDHSNNHYKHDEHFLKSCGRKLAQMGNEFSEKRGVKVSEPSAGLRDSILRAAQAKADEKETEEKKAWEVFRETLDKTVRDSDVKEPYQALGTVFLLASGLKMLGSRAVRLTKDFTMRFIRERHLDNDIARIGGLDQLVAETD